jgi:hypothetical protein
MSSHFFDLSKTAETPENKAIFRLLSDAPVVRSNPLGPDRP